MRKHTRTRAAFMEGDSILEKHTPKDEGGDVLATSRSGAVER